MRDNRQESSLPGVAERDRERRHSHDGDEQPRFEEARSRERDNSERLDRGHAGVEGHEWCPPPPIHEKTGDRARQDAGQPTSEYHDSHQLWRVPLLEGVEDQRELHEPAAKAHQADRAEKGGQPRRSEELAVGDPVRGPLDSRLGRCFPGIVDRHRSDASAPQASNDVKRRHQRLSLDMSMILGL